MVHDEKKNHLPEEFYISLHFLDIQYRIVYNVVK